MKLKTVFITGANGFVGKPLSQRLLDEGWRVKAGVRVPDAVDGLPAGVDVVTAPDVSKDVDWTPLFSGVDAVVHLIARTHVMHERAVDPLEAYRQINVQGTRRVAAGALRAGVSRFIFMSSIKAVGEGAESAYSEATPAQPEDAYGISKLEAEQELFEMFLHTPASLSVVRPPLIYGANARGNLLRLMRLARLGIPLPLGGIRNARSMVYVKNLTDAVATLLERDHCRGLYHVADAQPQSTSELLRVLAAAQRVRLRLLPTPISALRFAGRLFGRSDEIRRLLGSLTVSIERMQRDARWKPPHSAETGLTEMVDAFLAEREPTRMARMRPQNESERRKAA